MAIYDKDKKAKQTILHSNERISYFCYLLFELKGVKNYADENPCNLLFYTVTNCK